MLFEYGIPCSVSDRVQNKHGLRTIARKSPTLFGIQNNTEKKKTGKRQFYAYLIVNFGQAEYLVFQ